MRAIIPVAGFGKRLKPHTYTLPKVLLNVGGKPILGHILDKLVEENIFKATFIIGHLGDKIKEFVEKEYPLIKADFVEQKEMLGLGHAIYMAIPTFDEKEIFIILGDTVFDVELKKVFSEKQTALGVKQVEDPSRFGVAITEGDRIIKLVEKPKTLVSKLALVGLYYISDSKMFAECLEELINKDIRTNNELQLTDALQIMIDKKIDVKTFPVDGWYDCGKPETLLSTNQFLLNKHKTTAEIENVIINNPVFIADNAIIKNSVIGPYATISDGCEISNSIISNSIIGANSQIEKVMLENSIIGTSSVVKGNFKRLNSGDSSEIELY